MAVSARSDVVASPPVPRGGSEVRALTLVAPPEEGGPAVGQRRLLRGEFESDEHLARRGTAGLDELYRRHQGAVYRYCVGVLRSPEEAADASQSAWVRALVALSATGVAVLNVRPWLYAIARNECLDRLRAGRDVQTVDVGELEVAGGVLPEEAHEAREEVGALLGDLGALSERQRSAIVLRELCGLGADELAEALGTTAPRALGLVADARRRLTERRSGRLLACEQVRHELARARRRAGGVCAHLEACRPCQSFERRRRGRALSSLGLAPWGLVRLMGEKVAAIGATPAAVKGVVAAGLVAGTVSVSPPVVAPAPSAGASTGAHHERIAEAGQEPAGTAPRRTGAGRVRASGSPSPTVTAAGATRSAARPRRAARRPPRAPVPAAPDTMRAPVPLGAPPASSGPTEEPSGGGPGPGSPTALAEVATTLPRDTVATVEQATGDVLPAAGRVARDTLRAAQGATGALGGLSR